MHKTSLSLAILTSILMIIFLMQPIAQVTVVKANPFHGDHLPPSFYINSPENRTYPDQTISIELEFVEKTLNTDEMPEIFYSIDGSANKTLDITGRSAPIYIASGTMYNLTNGSHSFKAYAVKSGETVSNSVNFLVDTSFIYPAFLLSPRNITYNNRDVPLEFITNQTRDHWGVILEVEYTLDNNYEVQTEVNRTITGLSDGQHKIVVECHYDVISSIVLFRKGGTLAEMGFYSTKTVYFTIDTSPNPTPILTEIPTPSYLPMDRNAPHLDPIFYLIPISVIVAVAVIAFVVYRKRKLTSKQSFL